MGSKTAVTHALSSYILSVIDLSMGHEGLRRLAPPTGRGQSGSSLQSPTALRLLLVRAGDDPASARGLTRVAAVFGGRDARCQAQDRAEHQRGSCDC